MLGPPVVPFLTNILGKGSPTKIGYRNKGTLVLTSLLEDLVEKRRPNMIRCKIPTHAIVSTMVRPVVRIGFGPSTVCMITYRKGSIYPVYKRFATSILPESIPETALEGKKQFRLVLPNPTDRTRVSCRNEDLHDASRRCLAWRVDHAGGL